MVGGMGGGGGLQQGWMRQQAVPVFQVGQAQQMPTGQASQAAPQQGLPPSRLLSPSQPYPPYQPPPPSSLPPQPYMRLISNDELDYHSRMQVQQAEAEKLQNQQQILSIGTHIRTCFEAARNAKQQSIQPRLLKCLRQRLGEYEADELTLIQSRGGSEVFIMITNIKCRALESWCRDILRPPGGKPFSLNATPIPTLSPQLEQRLVVEAQREILEAGAPISSEELRTRIEKMKEKLSATYDEEGKKRSDKLEEKVDDDFKEGGWYSALDSLLYDIATFPTAFLKGPTIRRKARIVWDHSQDLMNPEMRVEKKLVKEYDRVSPFDIFPSPGARTLQDGYLLERDSISRSELASLAGTPGYHSEQIRLCLQHYGRTGYREWDYQDQERARLESREEEYTSDPEGKMDSLIFWGSVQGSLLIEWGMREHVSAERRPGAMVTKVEPIEPEREYQVCARAVGQYVIKAIVNPDPLGNRPYYSASFENVPGSIWGKALPEVMAPEQYMCNAAARSVVNNMGMASGPQVAITDASRLMPGEKSDEFSPWKVWQFKRDPNGGSAIPIQFFSPNPMTDMLLKVYDYWAKQAGESTGIPNYVYGMSESSGAARTATGLSMLMNAAGKGIKSVIFHIDDGITVPSVRQHAYHVMLYDSDHALKGDVFVVPRGSTALIVEEQRQIRLNEFMSLALRSPIILEILGKPAMAELVRSAVESLDIDLSGLIPDEDAVAAEQEQQKVVAMLGVLSERLGIPMEVMAQALMEAGQGQGGGQGGAGGGNVRQSPPLQGGNGAAGPPIIAPQQMNQAGVRGGGADFQAMMARAGNGGGVQ